MVRVLQAVGAMPRLATRFWPITTIVVLGLIASITLGILSQRGEVETGFSDKTIWDWLEVVGVPITAVVIAGGFAIAAQLANDRAQQQRELEIERARAANLSSYLEFMSQLVLRHELTESEEGSAVRAVANAQTFAALRILNGPRKGILLRFLHDAKLITKGKSRVSLGPAPISAALI